jgi:hypothetical protein
LRIQNYWDVSTLRDTVDTLGMEKPDSSGHGNLTQEIEPTTDP